MVGSFEVDFGPLHLQVSLIDQGSAAIEEREERVLRLKDGLDRRLQPGHKVGRLHLEIIMLGLSFQF